MEMTKGLGPSNDSVDKDEMAIARELARKELANQKFHTLTAARKRVAIAKDVLTWLGTGKLKARTGVYLYLPEEVTDVVNGYSCSACALGGLFAAAVEHDECGGTVVAYTGAQTSSGRPDTFNSSSIVEKMEGIFEPVQLGLIECAFEGWVGCPTTAKQRAGRWDDDVEVVAVAEQALNYRTHNKLHTDQVVMTAIMRNIIRHKGTFVPGDWQESDRLLYSEMANGG